MTTIDPVTAIMSLALFGVFTIPFIYYYQKNRKKEATLRAKLIQFANSMGGKPLEIETWRYQYALGLDSENKQLYYLQSEPSEQTQSISLAEVKKVQIHRKNREIEASEGKRNVLDEISLEIQWISSGKKPVYLEIYNQENFSDLMGETVIADKWVELLKKHIN